MKKGMTPRVDPGFLKMRIGPPYPQRVVKGDSMGRFLAYDPYC